MKKLKTQKGITLIALIITIVVLLILAVVSIGAVKNSNIVGHAQNASSMYQNAKGNEMGILVNYESEIEKYGDNKGDKVYYNEFLSIQLLITQGNYITMFSDESDPALPIINNKQLVDITNNKSYNITFSEESLKGEDYKLFLVSDIDMVFMLIDNKDIMYFGQLNSTTNSIIVVKDYEFVAGDSNIISTYYNNSSDYEYYYGGHHNGNGVAGDNIVLIDYKNKKIKYYEAEWINDANEWVLYSVHDFTTTQNDQTLNIKVEYDDVDSATITPNAQKITYKYNGNDLHAYLENGKLYMNISEGVTNGSMIDAVFSFTKVIKVSALPT